MGKLSISSVILCVVFLLNACESDSPPGKAVEPKTRPPVDVVTWIAEPVVLANQVESVGTLVGNESVTITAKVTDQVTAIHFEDGQQVKAGDILIELTSAEQQASLREAEANLLEAELQSARLKRLGNKIVTAQQLDEASARVKASKARLEVISVRVQDRLILAPFDGLLGFRQVSEGALVTPGTVITELDDIRQLKLDFSIPEIYLGNISIGSNIESTSPAWHGETFSGSLISVGSRIDVATRTFMGRALIDNSSSRLRPGMLMNVTLSMAERTAMVVPEQAIVQTGKRSIVYVTETIDEQLKVKAVPVTMGARVPGGVEILSGLELGQEVVVTGQLNIRPGTSVRAVTLKKTDDATSPANAKSDTGE
ncbi:MAG: efflux RND transporter periplasmic adaptor subunit [Oceanicoccus sp.]